MNISIQDIVDIVSKLVAAIGILIAALNYRSQTRTKRAEWLKSLFQMFYEKNDYKEVRVWLDSGELEKKVNIKNSPITKDDEKFTDFLNFFEFIAKLEEEKQLKLGDVKDMFEYYLKRLNNSTISSQWINEYGFEKLRTLLQKIK